jgi:hypothetical protein
MHGRVIFLEGVYAWVLAFCDVFGLADFTHQSATVGRILRTAFANAWDCMRWRYGVSVSIVSVHNGSLVYCSLGSARHKVIAVSSPSHSMQVGSSLFSCRIS